MKQILPGCLKYFRGDKTVTEYLIAGVVDIRPTNLSEGKLIEVKRLPGEIHGTPETEVMIIELHDGSRIERSCSVSSGEVGTMFSGYTERRL